MSAVTEFDISVPGTSNIGALGNMDSVFFPQKCSQWIKGGYPGLQNVTISHGL